MHHRTIRCDEWHDDAKVKAESSWLSGGQGHDKGYHSREEGVQVYGGLAIAGFARILLPVAPHVLLVLLALLRNPSATETHHGNFTADILQYSCACM